MKNPISDDLISEYTSARDRLAAKSEALAKALRTGLKSGNHYDLMKAGGALYEWQIETIEFAAVMNRIEFRLKAPPPRSRVRSMIFDIWPAWLLAVCTVSMAIFAVTR